MKTITRNLFIALISLALSSHQHLMAQLHITGYVKSAGDGKAIPGASVYFNNSSIGTMTDETGRFTLYMTGLPGTELVISCIGYKVITFKATLPDTARQLLFKMEHKQDQLKRVVVLSKATRQKWLSLFKDNFLGITEQASKSVIENESVIYFTDIPEVNSFNAWADSPLVIINKMLGYRIYFQLEGFEYNEKENRTFFYGYARFEDMGKSERRLKNRRDCYYGSTMHFYRSLISHHLRKENFDIFFLRDADKNKPDSGQGPLQIKNPVLTKINEDSIILKDTVFPGRFLLNTREMIYVRYYSKTPVMKFLLRKTTMAGKDDPGFYSIINIRSNPLYVDDYGLLDNPMGVDYAGYWIYEKTGCMLPLDYMPE